MPRFQIHAEFELGTTIEPELGRHSFDSGGVDEFDDDSYFQSSDVSSSGGSIRFVVEADSEEDAESKVEDVVYDGMEVEDSNGLTWLVESVSVEVEEIEEPMTMEKAEAILIGLAEGQSDPKVKEAVEFVFDAIGSLDARLLEAMNRIDGLVERVRLAETTVTETVDPVAG